MTKTINLFENLDTEGTSALKTLPLYFEKQPVKSGTIYRCKLVRLSPSEYRLFRDYIAECNFSGFIGINNYIRVNEVREFFYRWFLDEIIKKVSKERPKQMCFIRFTIPEIKTLKAMFQRVDCGKEMIELQKRFY